MLKKHKYVFNKLLYLIPNLEYQDLIWHFDIKLILGKSYIDNVCFIIGQYIEVVKLPIMIFNFFYSGLVSSTKLEEKESTNNIAYIGISEDVIVDTDDYINKLKEIDRTLKITDYEILGIFLQAERISSGIYITFVETLINGINDYFIEKLNSCYLNVHPNVRHYMCQIHKLMLSKGIFDINLFETKLKVFFNNEIPGHIEYQIVREVYMTMCATVLKCEVIALSFFMPNKIPKNALQNKFDSEDELCDQVCNGSFIIESIKKKIFNDKMAYNNKIMTNKCPSYNKELFNSLLQHFEFSHLGTLCTRSPNDDNTCMLRFNHSSDYQNFEKVMDNYLSNILPNNENRDGNESNILILEIDADSDIFYERYKTCKTSTDSLVMFDMLKVFASKNIDISTYIICKLPSKIFVKKMHEDCEASDFISVYLEYVDFIRSELINLHSKFIQVTFKESCLGTVFNVAYDHEFLIRTLTQLQNYV